MARPRSSLFRHLLLLPCHFFFFPVVLVASLLAGAVISTYPNNHQPTRLVLSVDAGGVFAFLPLQKGSSAPTYGNMVVVFNAEPSPGSCNTTRCKKVCSSSTTTTPRLLEFVASGHGALVKAFPKLWYFCISTSTSPEEVLASNFDEIGCPACWLERWHSSPLHCVWGPPLHHIYLGAFFSTGRKSTCSDGCLSCQGRVGIRVRHASSGYSQSLGADNFKVEEGMKGSSYTFSLFYTLLASKHGSGNASLDVRADL